jgi:hypothetical protein
MKKIEIISVILCSSILAQTKISVNDWLISQFSKKKKFGLVEKIILKPSILDSINLNDYSMGQKLGELDINNDMMNDLVITIEQKYEKLENIKPRFASKRRYTICLIFVKKSASVYELLIASSKILNQDTEGLGRAGYDCMLKLNNNLILRQMGQHIDTEWMTDLYFEFNTQKKNLYFIKAVASTANLSNIDKPVIKDKVFEKIPKKPIQIDSVRYYDFFPLGFTDEFP